MDIPTNNETLYSIASIPITLSQNEIDAIDKERANQNFIINQSIGNDVRFDAEYFL